MLDPHLSDIKVVLETLLMREVPAHLCALRTRDILIRNEVVHNQHDLLLIEHFLLIQLLHLADRHRRGDIITMDEVELRHDQLTCAHRLQSCMLRQNLLAHRHSHNKLLIICILPPPSSRVRLNQPY